MASALWDTDISLGELSDLFLCLASDSPALFCSVYAIISIYSTQYNYDCPRNCLPAGFEATLDLILDVDTSEYYGP